MEHTRGLFCTCDSDVARCQSQHQWPTSDRTIGHTIVTIVCSNIDSRHYSDVTNLPETNGGTEYGSPSSFTVWLPPLDLLARLVQDLSVASKLIVLQKGLRCALFALPFIRLQ